MLYCFTFQSALFWLCSLNFLSESFSLYIFSALAMCLFRGRVYVEGDRKSVHDSEGNCLLFECRVSTSVTSGQWSEDFQQTQTESDFFHIFVLHLFLEKIFWNLLGGCVNWIPLNDVWWKFCGNLNSADEDCAWAWLWRIWVPNNGWIPSKFLI